MTLSIIIPFFNSGDLLRECLDSLIDSCYAAQGASEVEILLVDDGSADGSVALADEYDQSYPFISVIHSPHGGAAKARNRALERMRGRYVGFIDSDDTVLASFFGIVLRALREEEPDWMTFGLIDSQGCPQTYGKKPGWVDSVAYRHDLIRDERQRSFLCNKIFARHLFDGIRFDESLCQMSDFALMPSLADRAKTFYQLPDVLYVYRYRQGSITNAFDPVRMRERLEIARAREGSVDMIYRADARACALFQAAWICRQVIKRGGERTSETKALVAACVRFARQNLLRILCDPRAGLRRRLMLLACALGLMDAISVLYDRRKSA